MASLIEKFIYVILPVACALVLIASEPFWGHLEFKAYDTKVNLCRFLGLGHQQPTGRVVMVAIEEHAALKKKPFIFWYPDLGRFIKIAVQAKSAAVGLDLIPVHSLEQKMAESFTGMDGNIPSTAVLNDVGRQLDYALVSGLMKSSRDTVIVQGVSGSLVPFYYDLMAFMDNVKPASMRVDTDSDGILRSEIRNLEKDQEGFVAQLNNATGSTAPVPDRFRINFNFIDKIPVYQFEDILDGKVDRTKLKDKLIILGVESKHEDVHETPVGVRSGALIHAAGLETLLTRTFPLSPGMPVRISLLLALCFASLPFTRFRLPLHSFFCIFAMLLIYFIGNVVLFSHGYDLPMFPHLLAPVAVFTVSYLYRYMVEERGKRQLYKTFSYYVDPSIIDQLVTQDAQSLMKGERHDVCVMFLDIRGFTALSEKISSESLVAMLNIFFGKVSEVVQTNQGFVNKFIGDGILAFFAVGDRYVDDSLRASREICQVTDMINQSAVLAPYIGDHKVAIGIGLHVGSVILGNVGSERKLDFTVIGPPVNTASRIESLTKQYDRMVLVSEVVTRSASDVFTFESLGRAEVKGIENGVEIYALNM